MPCDLELTLCSFDTDLPLTCNDEDLDESSLHSPVVNSPTRMCCFVMAIKLNQILAYSLRTIVRSPLPLPDVFQWLTLLQYSTKKSKIILGYAGKRWAKHILVTLDSALNKWVDAVPEHRTLPQMTNSNTWSIDFLPYFQCVGVPRHRKRAGLILFSPHSSGHNSMRRNSTFIGCLP